MHALLDRLAARALAPLLLIVTLAACSGGSAPTPTPSPSAQPTPTLQPTPTPIVVPVRSAADAAALVIATDPRFSGVIELTPDIIGASKWWKAEALPGGGYRIELTIGWGDCPAGCIERHVWTFDVDPNGGVTLVSESGDPVPSDIPA